MSHFDELLQDTTPGFFEVTGDPCTYTDSASNTYETSVTIEKNVEQYSAYETTMPVRRNVANLPKGDIPEPKRGHTIQVGSETYTVDQLADDDGEIVRVLLQ